MLEHKRLQNAFFFKNTPFLYPIFNPILPLLTPFRQRSYQQLFNHPLLVATFHPNFAPAPDLTAKNSIFLLTTDFYLYLPLTI